VIFLELEAVVEFVEEVEEFVAAALPVVLLVGFHLELAAVHVALVTVAEIVAAMLVAD
jgi:hypothetical protein